MNVQHNCALHQCTTAQIRHVYQERERTDATEPIISHVRNPEDIVLNTAQMRDAAYVQRFRLQSPLLDEDQIITASAAREVALQKAARNASTPCPTTSMSVPQRLGQPRRVVALQENNRASSSHGPWGKGVVAFQLPAIAEGSLGG